MRKGVLMFLLVALSVVFVSCEYALGVRLIPLSELNEEKVRVIDDGSVPSLTFRFFLQEYDEKGDYTLDEYQVTVYYNKNDYKFYKDRMFRERLKGYKERIKDDYYETYSSLISCVPIQHLRCRFTVFPEMPSDIKLIDSDNWKIKAPKKDDHALMLILHWGSIYNGYIYSYDKFDSRFDHFEFDEWEGENGYMNERYVKRGYKNVVLSPKGIEFHISFLRDWNEYFLKIGSINYKLIGWRSDHDKIDFTKSGDDMLIIPYSAESITTRFNLYAVWLPVKMPNT